MSRDTKTPQNSLEIDEEAADTADSMPWLESLERVVMWGAASQLPALDSEATGGQPSQAKVARRPQAALEVDDGSKQATQPSLILDRCLARASLAAEKLDRLSASRGGKHVSPRVYSINQSPIEPGAQLEIVLVRASSLLQNLDHLTTRVSGTGKPAEEEAEAAEVEEESAQAETALVAAVEVATEAESGRVAAEAATAEAATAEAAEATATTADEEMKDEVKEESAKEFDPDRRRSPSRRQQQYNNV